MKKIILVFSFCMLIGVALFAQESTPKVNARQDTQHGRIQHGQSSDELTRKETALLRSEQKHIRRMERRVKADGNVSTAERKRLDKKQDRASRHIHRAKNNEASPN